MSTRYIHIVSVKGNPLMAFTSRWAARAWAIAVLEDNGFDNFEVTTKRLRIVGTHEEPPTTQAALL